MDTITLREYLFRHRISITKAARQLGVTRQYLGSIVNGAPAGRKLAIKIESWSNGEVKAAWLILDERDREISDAGSDNCAA